MEDHTLVEEREAVMHPLSGGNPTLRNAHFLKPIFSEHHTHLPTPPSVILSSKPTFKNIKKLGFRRYKGHPSEKWKIWAHSLKPKYQEIWKQAGVYEAILASTYKIPKDKELIMGLAERWCAETNTFVFPWGEVTITLEDVMFLGGYSVLGALFLTPLPDECAGIFKSLKKAYRKLKVGNRGNVTQFMWLKYFMCNGEELEHEAFLAMWLSRFVLVGSYSHISIQACHVAIHLSRGNRIALAPVVLASIYRDMRLLHNSIVESNRLQSVVGVKFTTCHDDLVRMWAWERFPSLRPTPVVTARGEPRSARWNGVTILKVKDVNAALDSGKELFMWRPYVLNSSSCMLSKLYKDTEQWVAVESDGVESFARCLRVSELVGLGYVEQYLPHRVAMQFGLDQDVPPHIIQSKKSPEAAWSSYNRSLRGMKLYIPPRLFESDVSGRYVVYWRGFLPVTKENVTTCIQSEKHLPLISRGLKKRRAKSFCTLGCLSERPDGYDREDNLTTPQSEILPKRTKISGERIDLDNLPVLNPHSGNETPAKLICVTELGQSGVQSLSSSDKCKESKSSTERPTNLKEDAGLSNANHTEVNNVSIKCPKNVVVSKANCPESNPVNIEGESCDHTTSELAHLGLMDRILRLEKIVEDIKAAKTYAGN